MQPISHVGGCWTEVNCSWPSCLKFFALCIETVMQGIARLTLFGKQMSFFVRPSSSPGRNNPKYPSPINTLNLNHFSFDEALSLVSALTRAQQSRAIKTGSGTGLRSLPGDCSSQAFKVDHDSFNWWRKFGRITWKNRMPCFASPKHFFPEALSLACIWLTKPSRVESIWSGFSLRQASMFRLNCLRYFCTCAAPSRSLFLYATLYLLKRSFLPSMALSHNGHAVFSVQKTSHAHARPMH